MRFLATHWFRNMAAVAGHQCASGGEGCLLPGRMWKLDSGQPASHVSAPVDRGERGRTIDLEALAALIRQLTHIARRQNAKARFCIAGGRCLGGPRGTRVTVSAAAAAARSASRRAAETAETPGAGPPATQHEPARAAVPGRPSGNPRRGFLLSCQLLVADRVRAASPPATLSFLNRQVWRRGNRCATNLAHLTRQPGRTSARR